MKYLDLTGLSHLWDKIKAKFTVYYGTCSTSASTQVKVVTCADFTLVAGARIDVKFTNAQSYNASADALVQLNINNTGAKAVMRNGTTFLPRYAWQAGEIVRFVYDGTNYIAVNNALATTTYYGRTKLSSSVSSTSTSMSATPSAVKQAYDLATQADTQATTNAGNIATNTSNIATNTGNISTNATNIATNTSNIATNTGNIATNTTNIATNTSNITANTNKISELDQYIAGVRSERTGAVNFCMLDITLNRTLVDGLKIHVKVPSDAFVERKGEWLMPLAISVNEDLSWIEVLGANGETITGQDAVGRYLELYYNGTNWIALNYGTSENYSIGGNLAVTGTVTSTGGFTGDLSGNATTATNATHATSADSATTSDWASLVRNIESRTTVGSDSASSSGWYKVCSCTMNSYSNANILWVIRHGFSSSKVGIFDLEVRGDSSSVSVWQAKWLARSGFGAEDVKIVVSGMTWTLYVYNASNQWGRISFHELTRSNTTGGIETPAITYYQSTSPESSTPSATLTSQDTSSRILYENTSGVDGNFTLYESIANYSYIEVYFRERIYRQGYMKFLSNGYLTDVPLEIQFNNGVGAFYRCVSYQFSGTSATKKSFLAYNINTSTKVITAEAEGSNVYIKIYKVVGYK